MDLNQYHKDLIVVRRILEVAAVKMAAERRTLEDIEAIQIAQEAFASQTLNHASGIEEYILFHLKVVNASNNEVLKSLFMKIIPDLLKMFNVSKAEDDVKYLKAINEHNQIIDHIIQQNSQAAEKLLTIHLENECR